ncbi:hypothetical protein PG984_011222 [Apiospora sp. TS-2023a]
MDLSPRDFTWRVWVGLLIFLFLWPPVVYQLWGDPADAYAQQVQEEIEAASLRHRDLYSFLEVSHSPGPEELRDAYEKVVCRAYDMKDPEEARQTLYFAGVAMGFFLDPASKQRYDKVVAKRQKRQ